MLVLQSAACSNLAYQHSGQWAFRRREIGVQSTRLLRGPAVLLSDVSLLCLIFESLKHRWDALCKANVRYLLSFPFMECVMLQGNSRCAPSLAIVRQPFQRHSTGKGPFGSQQPPAGTTEEGLGQARRCTSKVLAQSLLHRPAPGENTAPCMSE